MQLANYDQTSTYSAIHFSAEPILWNLYLQLRTLNFLSDNKCTLTILTSWDGTKEQEFNWKTTGENKIELTKLGFAKRTFKKIKYNERTYLVDSQNLANFKTYLLTLEQKPTENSDQFDHEKYLTAKEKVVETLSR